LKAQGTSVRREVVAGATTFLTLAYIMFVNPKILAGTGMSESAVFVATCLASALTTAMMGLYAKLPVALAPGMGLNAYFAFTVVPALGGDWRLALGCVFLSGILFVALSLTPAREWLINAIPKSLKLAIAAGIGFFLALIGFANVVSRPKRFRWNAVVQRFDVVGVRALGIIGLMSFLIGIVVAQQGAVQLAQFGAEVYTINLIGRITVRELGVLMTAIMVAGRSGSAFAAQIGTMKITEEIDAMRTIGVSPVEALVLPRLMAAVLMMPLLAFWAMLTALLGGGIFVWLDLQIPPLTYIQRLQEVTPLTDLWIALIKAPVFGFIIALAGCFQGMLVQGNSEEVGSRTTTAVVQSIFLVIVLDAIFAVFFSSIGWV